MYFSIYNLRIKNQVIAEGEEQGRVVMQILTQTIRNAVSITSPTTGNSGATLTLQTNSSGTNPTIFSLSNGILSIQEGSGSAVALNSARAKISNLNFQNLTRASTDGIIRVSFTVTYTNANARSEQNFVKNFYDSAAVRGPLP